MKKILFIVAMTLVTLVGVKIAKIINAQAPSAPAPYTPPHPYPLPDDAANFPQPGNVIKYYTGGQTVDQINDTVKYFRADTFTTQMRNLISSLQNETCGPNLSANSATVKQAGIVAINDHISRLTQKKDQIVNEGSLNDNSTSGTITAPYDHTVVQGTVTGKDTAAVSYSPVDLKIQQDFMNFYNRELTRLNGYLTTAQGAQDCDTLKGILNNAQDLKNSEEFRNEVKTLAVRIHSERLNYWSEYLDSIMTYNVGCISPYLDAQMGVNNPAGQGSYEKFVHGKDINGVFGKDARLYDDWYSTAVINDPTYRPFTKFFYQYMDSPPGQTPPLGQNYASLGAREEYRLAAEIGKQSNLGQVCFGAPTAVCRDQIHMHMRAAKYLLQDIFHVFWWEYDNLLLYQEQGNTLSINDIITYCSSQGYTMPKQRGQTMSGTQPSGFPAWPTTRPTRARTR